MLNGDYQVGGSLKADASSYATRSADEQLFDALLAGQFCYVLNCRQMGKSSLRVRAMQRLKAAGCACAAIDLTRIGSQQITIDRWYTSLISALTRSLGLGRDFNLRAWISAQPAVSGAQLFTQFIEDVLFSRLPNQPIVIFFDEIDSLLSLTFASDDFFALIRSCYNYRADAPAYQHLTFCLLGVATPADLMQDKSRTPFNLGHAIDLRGFTNAEAKPLALGLEGKVDDPQAVLEQVISWTGGQPFLTQRTLQLVAREWAAEVPSNEANSTTQGVSATVARIIDSGIIQHWESQDEPEHLKTIRDRLLRNEQRAGALLGLYQRVLASLEPGHEAVPADGSALQMDLRLTGLVTVQDARLQATNHIYQRVFNASWVQSRLDGLRPYADGLSSWLASARTDSSRLLRGQALSDALQWAQDKRLSDDDYQFINASQQQAKHAVQLTLELAQKKNKAAEDAKRILASAHRKAKRTTRLSVLGFMAMATLALLLMMLAGKQMDQAREQEQRSVTATIDAGALRSMALFTGGNHFDALVEGLRAGSRLLANPWTLDDNTLGARVQTRLHEALAWGSEYNRLSGHRGDVWSVAFSPDGQLVASGGEDDIAILWHLDGRQIATLRGHQAAVSRVNFSPDGRSLVTASDDHNAIIWTLAGAKLALLEGHQGQVWDAKFSPDGQTIATASEDGTVRLWNLEGRELRRLSGHAGAVWSVAFSPDGRLLASASGDRTARLWSAEGHAIATLAGHLGRVWDVTFSPDGETLATASEDRTVTLWTTAGQPVATLSAHRGDVRSVRYSPSGHTIATASQDGTIGLWRPSGQLIRQLSGHHAMVWSVAYSPDGKSLISGGADGAVRFWRSKHPYLNVIQGHAAGIARVRYSPDNTLLASASLDQSARLWTVEGAPLQTFEGHQSWVISVAFSADGERLATASRDGTAKVWTTDGTLLSTLSGHRDALWDVAFSPSGDQLATASEDGTIKIWDQQGNELQTLDGHDGWVVDVAFDPQGDLLASASNDHSVRLWPHDGSPPLVLQGHTDAVWGLAFSPDGQLLASASEDGTVKLWNRDGNEVQTLRGHDSWVVAVAFSPDGQLLATSGRDRTVRLWRRDGSPVQMLSGFNEDVWHLAFSPDGQRLTAGDMAGQLTTWHWHRDTSLPALVAEACRQVHHYLQYNAKVATDDRTLCTNDN